MSTTNNQALASVIALPVVTALLHLAQDPTARRVLQDPDVVAAWRDTYEPLRKAVRVTMASFRRISEVDRLAAA